MFTIDTVVDTAVKGSKQFTALIKEDSFRKEVDALVDAQAKFAKSSYNQGLEVTKTFFENFGKFDAKTFDLTKWMPQAAK